MKKKIEPRHYAIRIKSNDGLHITVITPRLTIRSVTPADEQDCLALFGDPVVIKKFNSGIPFTQERLKARLTDWTMRWKNHDPYNFYVVEDKQTQEFMGMISIGHDHPGESELAYFM